MGRFIIALLAVIFGSYIGGYVALRASDNIQAWAKPGQRAAVQFEYQGIGESTQGLWAPATFVEGELRAATGNLPPRKPEKEATRWAR